MDKYQPLLERLSRQLRAQSFSDNTERAFVYWARDFLEFHQGKPLSQLNEAEVDSYLHHLISQRYAPVAIQNQALQALLFLFTEAAKEPVPWLKSLIAKRASNGHRNLLAPADIRQILTRLNGQDWLMVAMLYGAGLRLEEVVRLRNRDIDTENRAVEVIATSERPARWSILPFAVSTALEAQLQERKLVHLRKLAEKPKSSGGGKLPEASSLMWQDQSLFIGSRKSSSFELAARRLAEKLERQIRKAAIESGIYQPVDACTLRNSFAVAVLEQGVPKHWVAYLLGTPSACEQVPDGPAPEILSPLDALLKERLNGHSGEKIRVKTGQDTVSESLPDSSESAWIKHAS